MTNNNSTTTTPRESPPAPEQQPEQQQQRPEQQQQQQAFHASTHPRIHNLLNQAAAATPQSPSTASPLSFSLGSPPLSASSTGSAMSGTHSIAKVLAGTSLAASSGSATPSSIQADNTSALSSRSHLPSPTDDNMKHETTTTTTTTHPKKPRRKSSTNEEKVLLSTSSPEGIAAAAAITPNRVANILIKEGPLPIRHLTGHLIEQVPAFGHLSLSKQRRLIMASLESGDLATGCIFEKIGWGQWQAKVVGKDIVKSKIEQSMKDNNANINQSVESNIHSHPLSNSHSTSPSNISPKQGHQSLAPIAPAPAHAPIRASYPFHEIKKTQRSSSATIRRESITANQNEHNVKMPSSPTLGPIQNFRNSLKGYADIDEVIESSASTSASVSDDDDLEDETHSPNSDTLADHHSITSHKMISTHSGAGVNMIPNIRSQSMSSSRRPSFAGIVKPRKPRTSFTQHNLEVTLDDAPLERRESRVSFSNSANLSRQSFLRTNISPRLSNNNSSISFHDMENENVIIDEDEDSHDENAIEIDDDNDDNDNSNFTDEEDWKSMGASTLKKNRQMSIATPPTPNLFNNNNVNSASTATTATTSSGKTVEEMAAFALMDLKTV